MISIMAYTEKVKQQILAKIKDGMPKTVLAKKYGINTGTINLWLKKQADDFKSEINNLQEKEAEFILGLIKSFEAEFAVFNAASSDDLSKLDDSLNKLDLMTSYINAYYKIKNPIYRKNKQDIVKGASETIFRLVELAKKDNNAAVLEFIAQHQEQIIDNLESLKK